jgi:hypothetical protein
MLSTIPHNPIVVVKINISGPISAREVLTIRAFSSELNFNINIAAKISILPDINLKKAIPNIAFSIIINIHSSWINKHYLFHQYMFILPIGGQVFPLACKLMG